MITEDYCSFELSKLLKEKGFDGQTHGNVSEIPCVCYITHQMAMKWLREEHKIFVEISACIDLNGEYHFSSAARDKICKFIKDSCNTYNTYEEAVEAAIKYVLENLI